MVHLEMPIARETVGDFDKAKGDKRQFVDVVVSDLRDFVEDERSQERFFEHSHALFLEGKHFGSRRRRPLARRPQEEGACDSS
jgi:hypothetical protein